MSLEKQINEQGYLRSGWQPIETAPKDGTQLLLYDCGVIKIGSWREDDYRGIEEWLENDWNDFSTGWASSPIYASHWQPLPTPPKENNDE